MSRAVPAELCDPMELARLGRLELIANRVLEGFLSGKHRSNHKGASVEFSEHRLYTPGDELRLVDWRILGRRDRYYIRQFDQETNLHAYLVVDTSGSMGFALSTVSKLDYAKMAAAGLTRLLLNQRDAVGLVCADDAVRSFIPPKSTPDHFKVIVEKLELTRAAGTTSLAQVLRELAARIHRRSLVIVLSDCLDEDLDAFLKAMRCLYSRGHELLMFHVMAPEERNFAVDRWSRFESLEIQGQVVEVDPAVVRESYLRQLELFTNRLRNGCAELRCDCVPLSTDEPLSEALAKYFASRRARMKR